LKRDNQHLQEDLRLLEQRNEDRKQNGIQSKKAEEMADQAGNDIVEAAISLPKF
jgi:hypothetical protein